MESVYYYIGLIVFYVCFVVGLFLLGFMILGGILNLLGKKFNSMWQMVEYAMYRKDFKEYMKDKPRLKKVQDYLDEKEKIGLFKMKQRPAYMADQYMNVNNLDLLGALMFTCNDYEFLKKHDYKVIIINQGRGDREEVLTKQEILDRLSMLNDMHIALFGKVHDLSFSILMGEEQ